MNQHSQVHELERRWGLLVRDSRELACLGLSILIDVDNVGGTLRRAGWEHRVTMYF